MIQSSRLQLCALIKSLNLSHDANLKASDREAQYTIDDKYAPDGVGCLDEYHLGCCTVRVAELHHSKDGLGLFRGVCVLFLSHPSPIIGYACHSLTH